VTPNLFILVFPKTQKNVFGAGDVLLVGIDTRMSVDGGVSPSVQLGLGVSLYLKAVQLGIPKSSFIRLRIKKQWSEQHFAFFEAPPS